VLHTKGDVLVAAYALLKERANYLRSHPQPENAVSRLLAQRYEFSDELQRDLLRDTLTELAEEYLEGEVRGGKMRREIDPQSGEAVYVSVGAEEAKQ
jgi:hypothetical protein